MIRRGWASILRSSWRPLHKVVEGIQLWIHTKVGIFARIRVTSLSSRHLLAAIRCPSLRRDILVGHAPVQDEQDKRRGGGRSLQCCKGAPELVALLDTNGRVGSIPSPAVGVIGGGCRRRTAARLPGQMRFGGGQHL